MSQATNVIPDSVGGLFLTNLNDALKAIVENHSGTARPSYVRAGMLWIDTSTPGTGVWTLKLYDGTNDIPVMTIDSTGHAIQFASAGLPTPLLRAYLAGLTLSTAGGIASFGIAAGVAADAAAGGMMALAEAITKTTGAWTVGSGNGGLDTGTIANSTWYHVHLIKRPDTGVVDALLSLSAASPTLPTNYTLARRLGALLTDGSAKFVKFVQNGDEFLWDTPVTDLQEVFTNFPTTLTSLALTVPTGVKVDALFSAQMGSTALTQIGFFSPDQAGASATFWQLAANTAYGTAQYRLRTNTSAQVKWIANGAGSNQTKIVQTTGWIDRRGRDD